MPDPEEQTIMPPADLTHSAPDASALELAALKLQLAEAAKGVLAGVPDHLRGLIPGSLTSAELIDWYAQAKATGIFDKPTVPPTDGGARPAITPKAPDTSSLPIHARMAAGYNN